MKRLSTQLVLLGLLFAISPLVPRASADPLPGIEPTPASETVATALFDADVAIPDVYIKAQLLSPNQIVVSYNSGSSDAARFRETVQEASDPDAEISWKAEPYSPTARMAAGQQALEEARRLGMNPTGASFDSEAMRFTVYTTDPVTTTARRAVVKTSIGDLAAEVVFETSEGDGLQSRYSDGSPWKAGAALNFVAVSPAVGNAECTANFAWKRWGTGEILSSTANHCGNNFPNEVCATGRTESWFNDARGFGNLAFCNGSLDTQLLRRVSTTQTYAAEMWHGAPETASFGDVKTASVPLVDVRYYVSGANGGTRFAVVQNAEATNITGGPGVLMDRGGTVGGDSGAPWFSYLGNGGIAAIGLHQGLSGGRAMFVPLNPISAHFQASILTQ